MEPTRSYMDDVNIQWRTNKPNYDRANKKYLTEKSLSHAAGSLEQVVENLVKTWEMESTHKINPKVILLNLIFILSIYVAGADRSIKCIDSFIGLLFKNYTKTV